ncbi:hypothetical protein EB796_007406 [Bugula neritina]|uniref:Uncharacterized protein n=1 Tax=Bugula neritina TaxID=10212 RepID=A0A7J7K6N6_BUGNE|nr:hypothetical protein EB796_007406 [Bugula neritina]
MNSRQLTLTSASVGDTTPISSGADVSDREVDSVLSDLCLPTDSALCSCFSLSSSSSSSKVYHNSLLIRRN